MGKISNTEKSLRDQLKAALSRIESLELELIQYKEKNVLYLYKTWEEDILQYHPHLNPYPVKIPATFRNKSLLYEIRPTDIVCIISTGRVKTIYLKKQIENKEGELHRSDKIRVNSDKLTLEKLCEVLDSLNFRLSQVSKSVIVNVEYYHRNNSAVRLKTKNSLAEIISFSLGPRYAAGFDRMKNYYDDLVSFQSSLIDSKARIFTPKRTSFDKKNHE